MACLFLRYASVLAGPDPPVSDATTRSRAQHRTIMEQNGLCWAPVRQQPPKQNHVLLGASPVATIQTACCGGRRLRYSAIVTACRLPIQTRFGWALDGDGWAFGWEWMGVSAQPERFWMGYGWGFGWAFPTDGVVPRSARECSGARDPPQGQRVILGRRGRFRCTAARRW